MGEECNEVCAEHSGLKVWVQIGCCLLLANLLTLTYSSFIQGPETKAQLKDLISQQSFRIAALEREQQVMKEVDIRIITQRNLDHANKDKFQ